MAAAGPSRDRRLAAWTWLVVALVVASTLAVFGVVDLEPHVETDFFFANDDPQLRASRQIGEDFPAREQLLIGAIAPQPLAPSAVDKIRALTEELAQVPGIVGVQSLTKGPATPEAAVSSPVWGRLLLGRDPHMSQLLAGVDEATPRAALVAEVERVIARHQAPDFQLVASGVPFVVEKIRDALQRDLRLFSAVAVLAFGLLIAAVYRSLWIVAGALASCLGACATTLALLWASNSPIGLLTANIITIVFVLTLSHVVFITANARAELAALPPDGDPVEAVERALRMTLTASLWCTLTTSLGFASLLFSSAKPLRELGLSGTLATVVAIVVSYGLYPPFLRRFGSRRARGAPLRPARSLAGRPSVAWLLLALAGTLLSVPLLPRLETDPSLLGYFSPASEIRRGLDRIDAQGGSSPLLLVVAAPDATRLDEGSWPEKLAALQQAVDRDPEVGSALSLPVLLAEARRNPLAAFLGTPQLVDLLMSPAYDQVARGVLSEDRKQALFFLRMREGERQEGRRAVIERLRGAVGAAGLEARTVGGLYELQASLGELVGESVGRGLLGLMLLFVPIAALVARSVRGAVAMLIGLGLVPLLMLGGLAVLRSPLDVIASPAPNVAIGLGIDAMIHLLMAVRRRLAAGDSHVLAWAYARSRLWPAILGGMGILAAGFALFLLSSFPPTQRFGTSVALGTLVAAAITLWVLPRLAQPRPFAP